MHVRIKGIVDLFPYQTNLIDIGSDHGYLGIELLKSEKVKFVWNIDLSSDSLKRSKKIYRKEKLQKKAKFINGDGFDALKKIPEEAAVVIAGLGTIQILKILEKIPKTIKNLIILSHTNYFRIRKWSKKNKWSITHEKYVSDGQYVYLIMNLVKKDGPQKDFSSIEYIFGQQKFMEEDPELFNNYWSMRAKKIQNIPEEYRTEEDRETINFLSERKII